MSRNRSRKRPLAGAGVIPDIFVRVTVKQGYGACEYKRARIQLRRSKYRYLVWYEDRQKREFYLGQVRAVPLREQPDPPAPTSAGPARRRRAVGVGK